MQAPAERYLDLARQGRNEAWRYALGALTIGFFWLGAGYLPLARYEEAIAAHPLYEFIAVNFSIGMMLAGLAVAVRFIHGRSLRSLVTPRARIDWSRMARG